MILPMEPGGKSAAENTIGGGAARLVARLDGMSVLGQVYGPDAIREIEAQVDARLASLAADGLRVRRAGDGVYAVAANAADNLAIEQIVLRLQDCIGDHPIQTSAGPALATLSIGAAVGDQARSLSLLRRAGDAAADATALAPAGRCIAKDVDGGRVRAISIAKTVLEALRENRFALAYQPVLRADGTDVVAFNECLARLLERSGRIIPAGAFMPALENLRLTRLIDRRVLELALTELAAIPTLRLSLNLSAQSLGDPGWLRILRESEATAPGLAARLIVEITESAAIADEARAVSFLDALRGLGCAIALDDFGAGFSAFRHLKLLRPDILKIDGSFVQGVGRNPDNRALIESVMVVARHFEMMTVGEMVNDADDAQALRRLGVDCFQGHSFGRPTIEPNWRTAEWGDLAAI